MKYYDQHLHTRFSHDSKEEPENYLKIAEAREVPVFVSTEHLEFLWNNEGADWMPDFAEQTALYRDLSKKYPSVEIRRGVEIGYKTDHVKDAIEIIKKHDLQLVNLSVHDYLGIDLYHPEICKEIAPEEFLAGNFEKVIEAVSSDIDYDVLCHVDYPFRTAYTADKSLKISAYEDFLKEIFKTVIRRNRAIEINKKVQDRIGNREHLEYILDLYKSLGGTLITLSTDTHKAENYLPDCTGILSVIKARGFDRLCFFDAHKPRLVKIDELF